MYACCISNIALVIHVVFIRVPHVIGTIRRVQFIKRFSSVCHEKYWDGTVKQRNYLTVRLYNCTG